MVSAARRRVVYRALKSAIEKGEEIEYWIVKASDQFEAGVITETQLDELMTLAEPFLPEVEETPAEEVVIEPETTSEPTYTEETSW